MSPLHDTTLNSESLLKPKLQGLNCEKKGMTWFSLEMSPFLLPTSAATGETKFVAFLSPSNRWHCPLMIGCENMSDFPTDANYLVYVFVCLYFWALGGTGSNVVDEDDKHVNNIKNINRLILVKRHFLPLSLELAYLIVITMAQSATLHPSRVAQFAATASQFNYTSKCDLQHCKKTIDVRCLATFLLLYHNVLIQIKFTLSWYLL